MDEMMENKCYNSIHINFTYPLYSYSLQIKIGTKQNYSTVLVSELPYMYICERIYPCT